MTQTQPTAFILSLASSPIVKRPDFLRFLSVRRAFLQLPFARTKTPSELLDLIERWGTPTHATAVVRVAVLGSHPLAVRHFAQAYHVDATVNAARGSIMVRSWCRNRCLSIFSSERDIYLFISEPMLLCLRPSS